MLCRNAVVVAAIFIAGCAAEPPPGPMYDYPPSAARPSAPYRPAPQAQASSPRSVKPLGQGALASNVVEGYMDNEEGELRGALRGSGIGVARTGNDLLLSIKSDMLFEQQSFALSPRGGELIAQIASVLRRYDSTLIVANGFTDTTGTHEQNLSVSQKRADAVVKLFNDDGVEQKRLAAKGFGDEILKIPTGPNVSEPRNRRIDIRITPIVKT